MVEVFTVHQINIKARIIQSKSNLKSSKLTKTFLQRTPGKINLPLLVGFYNFSKL